MEILVGEERELSTSKTKKESPYKTIVNSIPKPLSSYEGHLDIDKTPWKECNTIIDNWAKAQSALTTEFQSRESKNFLDYLAASL